MINDILPSYIRQLILLCCRSIRFNEDEDAFSYFVYVLLLRAVLAESWSLVLPALHHVHQNVHQVCVK